MCKDSEMGGGIGNAQKGETQASQSVEAREGPEHKMKPFSITKVPDLSNSVVQFRSLFFLLLPFPILPLLVSLC